MSQTKQAFIVYIILPLTVYFPEWPGHNVCVAVYLKVNCTSVLVLKTVTDHPFHQMGGAISFILEYSAFPCPYCAKHLVKSWTEWKIFWEH